MTLKHVFRSLICGLFYVQVLRCQVTTFASNFVLHSSTQMCKLNMSLLNVIFDFVVKCCIKLPSPALLVTLPV